MSPPDAAPEPSPEEPRLADGGRIADAVARLAEADGSERITAGEIVDGFGERAFGVLIFVFATPNFMPIPMPGASAVLGVPLFLLSFQLLAGSRRPRLPEAIRRRSLRRETFAAAMRRALPWLRRMETRVRPRLPALSGRLAERVAGAVGLILAATIALPVPFGNALPALTLAILALGLAERDGVVVVIGAFLALLSLLVTTAVLSGLLLAGMWTFGGGPSR